MINTVKRVKDVGIVTHTLFYVIFNTVYNYKNKFFIMNLRI